MTKHARGDRYFRGTHTVIPHDANPLSDGGQNHVPEALGR